MSVDTRKRTLIRVVSDDTVTLPRLTPAAVRRPVALHHPGRPVTRLAHAWPARTPEGYRTWRCTDCGTPQLVRVEAAPRPCCPTPQDAA